MQFKQEYMNALPPIDEQYELFVRAWTAYHEAAHRVDGHLPPGHPDQAKLGHLAVRAGHEAMARHVPREVILDIIRRDDAVSYAKWQQAKLEALRRLRL